MINTNVRIILLTILLAANFSLILAQTKAKRKSEAPSKIRIAELNCENLFDTLHDKGFNDQEFLPTSPREWNSKRYWRKMQMLSREIASIGQTETLDLLALVEVENDTVLRDLTERTKLNRLAYKYIITHSSDARGIDVALLYLEGSFRPIKHHSLDWRKRLSLKQPTRDVLHVQGRVRSGDTLDIFVCHMPSRLGRARSLRLRQRICQALRQYIDSLQQTNPRSNIILLGDFNDEPHNNSLSKYLGAKPPSDPTTIKDSELYNLTFGLRGENGIEGTYFYQGYWERLDQCIVNGRLLKATNHLHLSERPISIVDHQFLLETDKTHKELKPKRTYQGTYYRGGFSDHLPILVELEY